MRGQRRAVMLLVLPAMAGCDRVGSSLPGPVAQLARYQAAESELSPQAIVDDALSDHCTGAMSRSDACPRLHAIRGRACLQLARNQAAPQAACPTAGALGLLECANDQFGAAISTGDFGGQQLADLRRQRGRAAYCLANIGVDTRQQDLARQATEDLAAAGAGDPASDQLAANAWLLRAGAGGPGSCDAYARAGALAERGLAAAPGAQVQGGLNSALRHAGSGAMQAGCGGH